MRPSNALVLASLNGGKLAEFQALFAPHKIQLAPFESFVRNATALAQVESEAPSATYYENAFKKCHAAFQACKLPTFADDSGIEVDSLKNAPGVHSAHYGKPNARESQDAANRRTLLEATKGKDLKARMRCVLVFMVEGVVLRAEGTIEGKLTQPKGDAGFGYDPIFIADGATKSFAEMTKEEKSQHSHRAKAVNALVKLMHEREIQLVRP